MKALNLTIGSDPELVIINEDMHPCSAIRVLGQDKHNPIDLGDGIKFYADNALAEIAFPPAPPSGVMAALTEAIRRAKERLGSGYELVAQAATLFSEHELKAVIMNADGTPRCSGWEIGCTPNFDAYRDAPNDLSGGFKDGMRTGSFHIHVGNAEYQSGNDERLLTHESKLLAIKLMDIYVGVSSLLWDKDPAAHVRRKLYGKAGEFRPTPYGIEYRVLGNYALRSRRLVQLVFDLTGLAMSHIEDGSAQHVVNAIGEQEVVRIINSHDVASAANVMLKLKMPPPILGEIFTVQPTPTSCVLSA